jgi:hypothetical protein
VRGDFLDSFNHDLAFYPQNMMNKPFGPKGKEYTYAEAGKMIQEMEASSSFNELYDPLELITQKPNPGRKIDSQIINTIVPESF